MKGNIMGAYKTFQRKLSKMINNSMEKGNLATYYTLK